MMSQITDPTPDVDGKDEFFKRFEIKIDDISAGVRKVHVTVPQDALAKELGTAFSLATSDIGLPGFRKGRAPKRIVEKRFGKDIRNEFLSNMLQTSTERIAKENQFELLNAPTIEPHDLAIPQSGPLTFTINMEVLPSFPLPDLAGIEVLRPKLMVTPERLAKAMAHLQDGMATATSSDGPYAAGDRVFLTGEITEADGTVVASLEQSGISAGDIISGIEAPGLMKAVEGKSLGDPIEMTFSAGDASEEVRLRRTELTIKATISKGSHRDLPEINDEFARQNGFDDLAELNQAMTNAMTKRLKRQEEEAVRGQLLDYLMGQIDFPLPPQAVINSQMELSQRHARELARAGVGLDVIKANQSAIIASCEGAARVRCKQDLIIRRFTSDLDVSLDKDAVSTFLVEAAEESGGTREALMVDIAKHGGVDGVALELLNEKTLDKMLESCKSREVDEAAWTEFVKQRQHAIEATRDQLAQRIATADAAAALEAPAAPAALDAPAATAAPAAPDAT